MNVLVACEESQRVCVAFRERGHNAFSCDIPWHRTGYGRTMGMKIMSRNIKICAICGRAIYDSEPKFASKPHKGKTVYAHIKCVYAPTKCKGGAPIGKTKESR